MQTGQLSLYDARKPDAVQVGYSRRNHVAGREIRMGALDLTTFLESLDPILRSYRLGRACSGSSNLSNGVGSARHAERIVLIG